MFQSDLHENHKCCLNHWWETLFRSGTCSPRETSIEKSYFTGTNCVDDLLQKVGFTPRAGRTLFWRIGPHHWWEHTFQQNELLALNKKHIFVKLPIVIIISRWIHSASAQSYFSGLELLAFKVMQSLLRGTTTHNFWRSIFTTLHLYNFILQIWPSGMRGAIELKKWMQYFTQIVILALE